MERNDWDRDGLGQGESGFGSSGADREGLGEEFGSPARPAGIGGLAGSANTPDFGSTGTGGRAHDAFGSDRAGTQRGGSPLEEGKEVLAERAESVRNRIEEGLEQRFQDTAERMEGIAQRIDRVADERMSGEGIRGRVGEAAHAVADRMENTADRLREGDAHDLLARLEDQVRGRPLESLLAAVATGWLIGKILR